MMTHPAHDQKYLLTVSRLGKTYGPSGWFPGKNRPVQALRDVSFRIPEGGTLGLIGESGSGKSTAAKCILRLTEITAGQVFFGEKEISAMNERAFRPYRKKIQIVFQDSGSVFNPRLTAGQMIGEILQYHRITSDPESGETPESLLECVGLSAGHSARYPHELSGGQRQRLGIARALAVGPALLVCDEPVSSLDVSVQSQILNLFKDLQREKKLTYLFIAHELHVIRFMADQIAVLLGGTVVERAGKVEWFGNPLHPYSRMLLGLSGQYAVPETSSPAISAVHPARDASGSGGCVYYGRCPAGNDRCRDFSPEETEIQPGHFIRCHVFSGI